ncbi:hypothetical protein GCM10027053_36040 [Intrasporangium mesophilum]
MDQAVDQAAMKAYVSWFGDLEHWGAHVEHSESDPSGESSEHETAADAVAWARERTDWVLVVTDPLQWAGSPDKQPPDVPKLWQERD